MFRHTTRVVPEGPLVCDSSGRPVGVRTPAATHSEEPRIVRRIRSLDGLRKTRELDAQYDLRCTVSLFCDDPPR